MKVEFNPFSPTSGFVPGRKV